MGEGIVSEQGIALRELSRILSKQHKSRRSPVDLTLFCVKVLENFAQRTVKVVRVPGATISPPNETKS